MRFLLAAVLSATCALAGCATNTSTDEGKAAVDEGDSASLRQATDIEATTAIGSSVTVAYKPEYADHAPYLAVEIVPDSVVVDDTQDIKVTGVFPSSPRIIVVNDQFKVLATTTTPGLQPDGSWSSVTTVTEPHQGKLLVIVHDPLWSKPMDFQVTASPVR